MADITFHKVQPGDNKLMQLIADWYLSEWNIPVTKTIERLKAITIDNSQLQVIMMLNDVPVSTGGLYNHVGLLDKEPGFKIYKNWLALVYTTPAMRHQGYGALICNYIQEYAKQLGVEAIYLFTDTEERLYQRLGWYPLERVTLGERKIVVMKKEL
jgi:GNAT superfamily N-acetyltransferase